MKERARTALYHILTAFFTVAGAAQATGPGRAAGGCPCDANIDQSEPTKTNPDPVNLLDMLAVVDCINGDCSHCITDCDVNCDGTVDFVDLGAAVCHFNAGTGSGGGCCNELDGACTDITQGGFPACVFTSQAACELFSGTYHGDNTICVGNEPVEVPAVSDWGLIVLTLSLAAAATIIISRQRHGSATS